MHCDSVLLVENLDICRYFYRSTLQLGEPFIDCNEMSAFSLENGGMLVLEKNPADYLQHASSPYRLLLHVGDLEAFTAHLTKEGVAVEEAFCRFHEKVLRISDPEGNIIWLVK